MDYSCFDGWMNAMEAIIFKIFIIFKSVNFFSQEGANGWEKWIPAKGFLSLHFRFMVENFIETMLSLIPISCEVRILLLLLGGLDGGSEMHYQNKYRRWIMVFRVNSDRLMLGQWQTQLFMEIFYDLPMIFCLLRKNHWPFEKVSRYPHVAN